MAEPTPEWGSPDAEDERALARRRLEAKRGFRVHLTVYVLVNLMLVGIWALTDRGSFWPIWAMFGWGIGVAWHAFAVYGPESRPITEADVDAEIRRRRGESA